MSKLAGKVALVTGAARGIGAAIAHEFVAEGAKVVVGDLLDEEGKALVQAIGTSATYVRLDVTKPEEWDDAVAQTIRAYGKLNVLVNNAGIANFAPTDVYSHADWEKIISINLTGSFNGIKAVIPALKNAGGGSIVNISSIAGLHGYPAMPGYVASKFGVRGLTKAAAIDLARYGIRVNSVHPGYVKTPMSAMATPPLLPIPMGRGAEPNEIASLVAFLASDKSSYSTGAEFIADGGEMAGYPAEMLG